MSFFEILLLAIGLSMDSLAVSITSGTMIRCCTVRNMIKVGCIMAAFQAGFAAIGYLFGIGFRSMIETFDHWLAFILLLYLGGKMIWESLSPKKEDKKINPLRMKTLCGLGIATSIDALAVGISLAILHTPLSSLLLAIMIVTFLFSASGIYAGNKFGNKYNLRFDLPGGIILILIGIKILIEHLFLN